MSNTCPHLCQSFVWSHRIGKKPPKNKKKEQQTNKTKGQETHILKSAQQGTHLSAQYSNSNWQSSSAKVRLTINLIDVIRLQPIQPSEGDSHARPVTLQRILHYKTSSARYSHSHWTRTSLFIRCGRHVGRVHVLPSFVTSPYELSTLRLCVRRRL